MKFNVVILALLASAARADFFRNDFLSVGHVRTDAIISPDCLSDHVHTFYGPPLLYPKVTFDDLRNSDPSLMSGNIEENLSLYWHPAVYHVAADGTKTLQESEMTTVYYNWVPGDTTAFPAGFRMVTPGEDVFDDGIIGGESEMEISISFQSCWDGENLDSPDHMSHVAFPVGDRENINAPCPSSHPVRIPRLDFFIRWFDTRRAKWEFSDGTGRFHADYVSGWDVNFLQSILDGGDGDFDEKVTFRAGIRHQGNDSELIEQLNEHAVPKADTSCITTEIIDNVINLPRETCTGTLISPIGVCEPSTPNAPTPTAPSPIVPTPTAPTPTVPTPTPPTNGPEECDDSTVTFQIFINGKRRWKNCEWVETKKTDERCGLDEGVAKIFCPNTCNTCSSCVDSSSKFKFYKDNGTRHTATCDWVAKNDERCEFDGVTEACRETCDLCE